MFATLSGGVRPSDCCSGSIDTKTFPPPPRKTRAQTAAVAQTNKLCHLLAMPHRLTYSGRPLDRAALNRQDAAWLQARMEAPDVGLLAVWHDRNLITLASEDEPEPAIISGDSARNVIAEATPHVAPMFLGLQDGVPVFAIDLSKLPEHEATMLVTDGLVTDGLVADRGHGVAEFTDIRSVGGLMSQQSGAILAYARGLAYWHRRHEFCGACGTVTQSGQGGHVRHCTNPDCGIDHFPRTDPAVIMLVTAEFDGEPHCLLGRQASWAPGMYSSLAGFVEPGESLEVAVAREVMEEASIDITDVEYRASQPWPFPSSLMLGFRARATTFDINVGKDELEEALWFSHSEIRDLSAANRDDRRLSRRDSIARWLIEDWMTDVGGE